MTKQSSGRGLQNAKPEVQWQKYQKVEGMKKDYIQKLKKRIPKNAEKAINRTKTW